MSAPLQYKVSLSLFFGSKNNFNEKPNNNDKNKFLKSDNEQEKQITTRDLDENVSSRHIVNVIA